MSGHGQSGWAQTLEVPFAPGPWSPSVYSVLSVLYCVLCTVLCTLYWLWSLYCAVHSSSPAVPTSSFSPLPGMRKVILAPTDGQGEVSYAEAGGEA